MNKSIIKIIIKNNIKIIACDFKPLIKNMLDLHNYPPFPSLILAKTVSTFIPLKYIYNATKLSVYLKVSGAIKGINIDVLDNNVRAMIKHYNIATEYDEKNFNNIPLMLGLGEEGSIKVVRQINNKETYTSETPLVKQDIVTDLAYYLNQSDQIFSAVVNDCKLDENDPQKINSSKTVIFQLLPGNQEEDILFIEDFVKKNDLSKYSLDEYCALIDGNELNTCDNLEYKCFCSNEKILDALKLFPKNEIEDILKTDGKIETKCEFCSKVYSFKEINN